MPSEDNRQQDYRKDVRREGDGWGVTVYDPAGTLREGKRYIYRTRNDAHTGIISDLVGFNGRIA